MDTTPSSSRSEDDIERSESYKELNQTLKRELVSPDEEPPLPLRSYNKWEPSRHGATLVWRDVCVYATCTQASDRLGSNGTKGTLNRNEGIGSLKRIINNSTGAIQPGTLMAMMGSSGAGKSTLMSALAYRKPPGTIVHGDILLNGRPVGPFMHRISGFVHQEDLFHLSLTVSEHLSFLAHLRLDRRTTRLEKQLVIYELLARTGLTQSANTRIGSDDFHKTLSGGERKRLAFASELLTNPQMLFCDEPTTGLDSFSAEQLVRTLLKLARQGTTIMCTIHQPSSQLFSMFHQVMLLAHGRIAFIGTPNQALTFFDRMGYQCPTAYNPADFLIGCLADAPGCERASQRTVQRICDQFAVSDVMRQQDVLVQLEMHMAETGEFESLTDLEDPYKRPRWPIVVLWLCYRSLLIIVRDPTIQTIRIVQKIIIALMAGLCFYGAIDLHQMGVQAVQGALFIMISENTFSPMYSVLALFPQSFPLFMRERRSGICDTVQYYLAQLISMIPGLIVEPFIFVLIGYWLAGLRSTFYAFAMTALLATLVMNVSTACGCLFSSAFNSVPLAMAYVVPFDYILLVTSGVFVQLSSMSKYWSWTKYLSWMMYANEAMSIIQWDGVENITCVDRRPEIPCLHNGIEVLEKYSFSMDRDTITHNIWIMISMIFIFHTFALGVLWRRARKIYS